MAAVIFFQVILVCQMIFTIRSEEHCEISSKNYCVCKFSNGSYINLHNETSDLHPSFGEVVVNASPDERYSYDPCFAFKEGTDSGSRGCASGDVAVCQKRGSTFKNIGDLSSAKFFFNGTNWYITYSHGDSQTNVSLHCIEDGSPPALGGKGEVKGNETTTYSLELHSRCACVDGCRLPSSSHSTAFYFFLCLFIGVFVYFAGGILYLKIFKGAVGRESIPHYEFWASIPDKMQAAWTYVSNGCKKPTDGGGGGGYDRI